MSDIAWRGPPLPRSSETQACHRFPSGRSRGKSFLQAHWPAVVAADFFTTEVWAARGLVTYNTLFAIELATRRVHVVGSTPRPDERFMLQALRGVTGADGILGSNSVFICDRDRKWSGAVIAMMRSAGVHVVQTPVRAPNCNAQRSGSFDRSSMSV